jgi:hypothetical protein
MKKELLKYLSGLCQAASAALLVAALIMPEVTGPAAAFSVATAILGAVFVVLRVKGE